MSMFIHSQQQFLEVAKFFIENDLLERDVIFSNITAIYCNQVIASNVRYSDPLSFNIDFNKIEKENDIKLLTDFEALKRLDSMSYQISESNYLATSGVIPAQNLISTILLDSKLSIHYQEEPEYENAGF